MQKSNKPQKTKKRHKSPISNKTQSVTVSQSAIIHSGPLPSPDILEQYNKIEPGTANRIISMAEKQAEHRQQLEKRIVTADIRDSFLGIICAFLLGAGTIVGGIIIALNEHYSRSIYKQRGSYMFD